jgi:cytochrome c biogenesis protein CcmG, thiol:disulfide interchange protein DsbE
VNFWASWCAPCVKEMPDFQRFSEELGDRVPLLGVNVQDAPSNAQAFVDELGITYDLATDPRGELYTDVRGFGMPTTLFVDAEGTIVYRHTGPLDTAQLRALVGEHLGVEV